MAEPVATDPIRELSGPLEVVMPGNPERANYPFRHVRSLVSWGISAVRIGVEGVVVARADDGLTRKTKIARWREATPDHQSRFPSHTLFNTNCPGDIGWDRAGHESRQDTGWPFRVKERKFYPGYRDHHNATCDGDLVYIYQGAGRDGKYSLHIEARTLTAFRKVWKTIVLIRGMDPSTRDDALRLESVERAPDSLTMRLVNENSGQVFSVQAPLPDKPARQRAQGG